MSEAFGTLQCAKCGFPNAGASTHINHLEADYRAALDDVLRIERKVEKLNKDLTRAREKKLFEAALAAPEFDTATLTQSACESMKLPKPPSTSRECDWEDWRRAVKVEMRLRYARALLAALTPPGEPEEGA